MTVEANKQLAGRFLKAWNAGAEDSIDGLAHPDFKVQYTHFREPVQDIERFKDILRQTHQQEQVFSAEPAGRQVHIAGLTIYRIADGQVIEERGIVDNMSLMSQLHVERRGDNK